jgi:hypothetical protein
MHTTATALAARLDVISLAMQEVLRLVLPGHACQMAERLRDSVSTYALAAPMSEDVDAAIARELTAQLGALGC